MADLIAGRYELDERIGSGGMAEVFRARDRQLDRIVAVKIMNRAFTSQPAFVERFRREAQAAASLDHPAIVPIYDWGETDESYFIAMAYVDGKTLREAYRSDEQPPVSEVLTVIATVASGLQHAHDRGIVHRDIKPQNILIDGEGYPRITDFGIARAAGQTSLTETSVVLGTANYLSPEQATRQPIDARSDIYSLGIVTYEVIAGRTPFQGESIVDLAMQHVHSDPPPLRSFRPDVSPEVERIVMGCLAKDPDERLQTAGQLRDELDRARNDPSAGPVTEPTVPVGVPLASEASHAAPTRGRANNPRVSAAPRGDRGGKRMAWIAIAVVGVAVIALLALILTQIDQPDEPDTGIVGDEAGDQSGEQNEDAVLDESDGEGGDESAPDAPAGESEESGVTDGSSDEGGEGSAPEESSEGSAPEESNGDQAPDEQSEPSDESQGGDEEPPAEPENEGNDDVMEQQSAAAQLPGNGVCDGAYESVSADRILVPGGANCSLTGGRVESEVDIQPGGTLQANGIEFMDDIQGNQAGGLDLGGGSYVDGDIQYSEGGSIRVAETTVEGNLEFESNSGPIEILGNVINGNIQVESNTGGATISDNQVDGNVECEENDPPPTGAGNVVSGEFEDQCGDL